MKSTFSAFQAILQDKTRIPFKKYSFDIQIYNLIYRWSFYLVELDLLFT